MSDAKELREAIERVRTLPTWNVSLAYCEHIETVISAAEAHLATLPREVTVERWAITDGKDVYSLHNHESEARSALDSWGKDTFQVVRLVGTALLPGSKE